jgi:hypothetical protein
MRLTQEQPKRPRDVDFRESASRRPSVSSLVGFLIIFKQYIWVTKSRRARWAKQAAAAMREMKNTYRCLVGNPEVKKWIWWHRRTDEDSTNINTNIKKYDEMASINMHAIRNRNKWRALVNTVRNIWLPQNERNFLSCWGPIRLPHKNGSLGFYGFIPGVLTYSLTTASCGFKNKNILIYHKNWYHKSQFYT